MFVLRLLSSLPGGNMWQSQIIFSPGNIIRFTIIECSDFPLLWKTRLGLENIPSVCLQSRLTASSVGQIVGLCSAEIKQIVSEYAEKVGWGPAGVCAPDSAPWLCSPTSLPHCPAVPCVLL